MLFPTVTFAVFFSIVLPVSWLLMRYQRTWRVFILVASYVFYGWWDWRFVFLLVASTVVNHVLALAIYHARAPRARRAFLTLAVGFDLGLLAYFKYAGFFATSVDNVVGTSWLVTVVLPVGISFYTFMAISYVVDTYRGELIPASFARFAVFQAFFPHLVAGPIVRASELLPQLESPRDPRKVNTARAFMLIVVGLFLKVVIANHLATHIVDDVFAAPNRHSSLEVLVAVYAYAVQIFADFCGYTNIAIGVALLLGFSFPQNFDGPYTAVSLQDFWRRWHMTLSRWLRDYLYIPLGGNRKGRLMTYRNLMLTMLLGGLWHGAAWTFVVWGGIHGAGLCIERALGYRPETARARWIGRIVTFHVVCFAWIFFRADSFARAGQVLERLFTAWGQPSPLVTTSVVLAILVGIVGQYIRPGVLSGVLTTFQRMPVVAQAGTVAVCLTVINTLGPEGVAPFIYFRF
ncbi:MAG TPA: MBOAT family protein [Gaiellaceae bacterium]|nr:MBOAT family protein [Gaiellaceae bacterium]